MKLCGFEVGLDRPLFLIAGPCAIESRSVIEVLPLVPARPIPLMPDYVRGIFTYRGRLVPLIDLGRRFAVGHEAAGAGRTHQEGCRIGEAKVPGSGDQGGHRGRRQASWAWSSR